MANTNKKLLNLLKGSTTISLGLSKPSQIKRDLKEPSKFDTSILLVPASVQ